MRSPTPQTLQRVAGPSSCARPCPHETHIAACRIGNGAASRRHAPGVLCDRGDPAARLVAAVLATGLILSSPAPKPAFANSGVPPGAGTVVEGPARVVDGDTLVVRSAGGEVRIRMLGIDAPESKQFCTNKAGKEYPCGQVSAAALAQRVGAGPVKCTVGAGDRYGRSVAKCLSASGEDLNAYMVKSGYAVAYARYSKDYVALERQAQDRGLGIWQGQFEPPESYRRRQREAGGAGGAAAVPAPPVQVASSAAAAAVSGTAVTGAAAGGSDEAPGKYGCAIKGNITRSGDKLYHLPGDKSYAVTKIEENKGERFFCSESEAVAAGWRHAQG